MTSIRSIAIRVIAVLLAFTIHEASHALASYILGDYTIRTRGRLTLNPMAHIDPIGLLCLLVFGFGWGKPVQVDPRYYKDQKGGMVWTAFAGPFSNFVLAFICIFLYYLIYRISFTFAYSTIGTFICDTLAQTAYISVGLGIFNCIPIPPLDGSKILLAFLPDDTYFRTIEGSPITSIIFMALLFSGIISSPILTLETNMITLFSNIIGGILF